MSIAFMYSGQGSQYVGMLQELYETYDLVKNRVDQATELLGYDVSDVLFNNEEKLNDTLYTQPLMFVMYASITDLLKSKGIESAYTLGLSLGEYGALYDAGVFDFETGLKLLEKRGEYMAEASRKVTGKMSAILGLDEETLERLCDEEPGYVKIANYNTNGQLVLSGEEQAVINVSEKAKEAGAKRAILLNTSGPFHSDLMSEASVLLRPVLASVDFKEPTKPVVANTTGNFLEGSIKEELKNQITSSVRFTQSINTLIDAGVETFIEIGPKKTLCGFVKKVDRKKTMLNVEDNASLEKVLSSLEV